MRVALLLTALLLAGCVGWSRDAPDPAAPSTATIPVATPPPQEPLVFGGLVVDAITRGAIPGAQVRLDLAQTKPCGNQGLGWSSWTPPVQDGAWGPLQVPRPRSDDVAFFLHVGAPGYTANATFIGPAQARGDLGNLTIVLHARAAIEGNATPGTIVALDAPDFPRFTVADETGAWRFEGARVVPAGLVVAESGAPYATTVAAPAVVEPDAARAPGWTLEGSLRSPTGAPLAADVAAWNGTQLWSAGRAGDNGVFVLPLPPEPVALRIEARTADGRFGGARVLNVDGPPATRETIAMRARC